MAEQFEVRWEGELPASPQEVWNAFTVHTTGWYWKIEYEPRVGGAERGLTSVGGTVTAWDPPWHFTTRAPRDGDGFNQLDYRLEPSGAGTHLLFVHRGVMAEDYDRQLDACRQHTAFYYHSLGEYLPISPVATRLTSPPQFSRAVSIQPRGGAALGVLLVQVLSLLRHRHECQPARRPATRPCSCDKRLTSTSAHG